MAVLLAVMVTTAWAESVEVQTAVPMATLSRLARAYATPSPDDSPDTSAKRARLAALMQFVARLEAHLRRESVRPSDVCNMIGVVRNTVDTGTELCLLPEEALCWERVGLDLMEAYVWQLSRMPPDPNVSPSQAPQYAAQMPLYRSRYEAFMVRCVLR